MSSREQEELEVFWESLLRTHPFAYTLFGNKPMSLASYVHPLDVVNPKQAQQAIMYEKGWKTWRKYAHFLPKESFILKKSSSEMKGVFRVITLCLINRKSALSIISKNRDLFKGKSPEEYLEDLCTQDKAIELNASQLGILLGFGRKNSILFERWSDISNFFQMGLMPPFDPKKRALDKVKSSHRCFFEQKLPAWQEKTPVLTSFSSLVEEFNYLSEKRIFFHLPGSLSWINYIGAPTFVDHGENPEILHNYKETRKLLREHFNGENSFLELILHQWRR